MNKQDNTTRELRLGLVGLDTSHVTAFTALLNDESNPCYVPGARVVAAFPGGSPDFELSWSRVQGFTDTVRDQYGVTIVGSAAAVAEQCDAILMTAVDGRAHLALFSEISPYGKPTYIDKPFTTNSADACEIVALAEQHLVPLMSCSSLRYSHSLTAALHEAGPVTGADCFGPMSLQPTQPGYLWYGIHSVEMLYTILGAGCESVSVVANEFHDVISARWLDGRLATVRGNRCGNPTFGAVLHGAGGSRYVDAYAQPALACEAMLRAAVQMFRTGAPPFEISETLEILRFIEAANQSRESGEIVIL